MRWSYTLTCRWRWEMMLATETWGTRRSRCPICTGKTLDASPLSDTVSPRPTLDASPLSDTVSPRPDRRRFLLRPLTRRCPAYSVYNEPSKTGPADRKRGTLVAVSKNYPHTGLTVDSYLLPTSKSHDIKTRTKIKNPAPISFRYWTTLFTLRGTIQ